ncbi:MAG: hypothetical protein R6V12_05730 [Candidatus Hydrogenedentota bacterium]
MGRWCASSDDDVSQARYLVQGGHWRNVWHGEGTSPLAALARGARGDRMKLTLTVPDHYDRLTNPAERRALERALAAILGYCRVAAMESGGRTWERGGNGHALTEAQVEGMVCSLGGG